MIKSARKITSICLIIVVAFAVNGCVNKGDNPSPESARQQVAEDASVKEKAVMDNFNAILQKKDVTIPEIKRYIEDNITAVSQTNASNMVIGLEKVQKENLPKLQDKFGDSEVQEVLSKIYRSGLTSKAISSIKNTEAKDLLLETQKSGFKIETAEGMFFPVIDYALYKRYSNAVTQDIAAFIDIMAVESDKTPIKDAALLISWSEILKRAMTEEHFIKEYSYSAKIEDIRQLQKRYAAFALYGANNTPLFSYDTKQMVPEAKKAYLEALFDANRGSFSKIMIEYLAVLKKNDYKLTADVQEYRNKAFKEIR